MKKALITTVLALTFCCLLPTQSQAQESDMVILNMKYVLVTIGKDRIRGNIEIWINKGEQTVHKPIALVEDVYKVIHDEINTIRADGYKIDSKTMVNYYTGPSKVVEYIFIKE